MRANIDVSHLQLSRRPLTDRELLRALVRYPAVTLKVVGAIHWEALRLWWKGARYHPKPAYDPESARRVTSSALHNLDHVFSAETTLCAVAAGKAAMGKASISARI